MTTLYHSMSRFTVYTMFAVTLSPPGLASTLYNFSYTAQNGDVISGQLGGTLQPDMNTIAVESIPDTFFNGKEVGGLFYVQSVSDANPDPVASLKGTPMNWGGCIHRSCDDGPVLALERFLNTSGDYGNHFNEPYEPSRWSISALTTPVPEPNAMSLIGLGGVVLAGWSRRRS